MDEYIKKESAIKFLLNDSPEQVGYSREDAADCVRYMDAADVAPVRHGRWVNERMIVGGFTETWACDCSVCGRTQREPLWKPSYCPNCGAIMDLEG